MTEPATIKSVRVSERGKTQLITLKRYTGLQQWNALCRWALCRSFVEGSRPSPHESEPSNVEMSWPVFGGRHHGIYLAMIKQRAHVDGLDPTCADDLRESLWRHLHRGLGYLAGDARIRREGVAALLRMLPTLPDEEVEP